MKHRSKAIWWSVLAQVTVAGAVAAAEPPSATDSAIAMGDREVKLAVPLAGALIQSLVGSAAPLDKGSYRVKAQNFCEPDPKAVEGMRRAFESLCKAKGGSFSDTYCVEPSTGDSVYFLTSLTRAGSKCLRLTVGEPTAAADAPEWMEFVKGTGYVSAGQRKREAAAALAKLQEQRVRDAEANVPALIEGGADMVALYHSLPGSAPADPARVAFTLYNSGSGPLGDLAYKAVFEKDAFAKQDLLRRVMESPEVAPWPASQTPRRISIRSEACIAPYNFERGTHLIDLTATCAIPALVGLQPPVAIKMGSYRISLDSASKQRWEFHAEEKIAREIEAEAAAASQRRQVTVRLIMSVTAAPIAAEPSRPITVEMVGHLESVVLTNSRDKSLKGPRGSPARAFYTVEAPQEAR